MAGPNVKSLAINHSSLDLSAFTKCICVECINNILSFQAFVESNPTLKWCPSPGCGRAVRLPSSMLPSLHVAVEASSSEETEPMIVDCGHGHFFCW